MSDLFQTFCQRAQDVTGLDNFGKPSSMALAETLLSSYTDEARLSRQGWWAIKQQMLRLLVNRLELYRCIDGRTDLPSARVEIVIFGIPRSGSSFLQTLLTRATGYRTPVLWESLYPFRTPQPQGAEETIRRAAASSYLDFLDRQSPSLRRLHFRDLDVPEESITLQEITFLSHSFEASAEIPSYSQSFLSTDGRAQHEELRDLLSVLTNTSRSGWILKAPAHVFHLQAVAEVFPNALFVQTHRHPALAMSSFAGLMSAAGQVLRDRDSHLLIHKATRMWEPGITRAEEWRSGAEKRVVDVSFTELTESPERAIERIMTAAGRPWTDVNVQQTRRLASELMPNSQSAKVYESSPIRVPPGFERYVANRSEYF